MRGIFTGMSITLRHLVSPKVTRLYPYEKRVLPPRMRGLIHYLKDENGQYKCEGCLLCEKVCPPQAITVTYRQRETPRERPLTSPMAIWANLRRSRRALLSHQGRPELAIEERAPIAGEAAIRWERVSAVLADGGLAPALGEVQATVGYLPRHAVVRLADEAGVDLSDAYSLATSVTGLRPASSRSEAGLAICQCPICRATGAAEIVAAVSAEVAAAGGTLPARLPHPRCLGDARQAPVMVAGGRAHGDLTPDAARLIARQIVSPGGSPR